LYVTFIPIEAAAEVSSSLVISFCSPTVLVGFPIAGSERFEEAIWMAKEIR